MKRPSGEIVASRSLLSSKKLAHAGVAGRRLSPAAAPALEARAASVDGIGRQCHASSSGNRGLLRSASRLPDRAPHARMDG